MTSEDGPCRFGTENRYTREQISDAIDALSAAEMARIAQISRYFAPRSGMPAEDLRQEAYLRALDTRTCAVGTDIVGFLAGIMMSIASEAPRAKRRAQEEGKFDLVFVEEYGKGGVPEPAADRPSPEDETLSKVFYAKELEKVAACIDGDEHLQFLVEGLHDGLRGKDLEELLGTDTKGLAAAKRRLARKLLADFPSGAPI